MKKLSFFIIFIIAIVAVLPAKAGENLQPTLAQFTWQHRVVITSVASATELSDLKLVLEPIWSEIEDRKLIVLATTHYSIYILNPHAEKYQLNIEELHDLLNSHHTLLIGLDGGIKSFYNKFDSRQIFSNIDEMPMRRARIK